ncbi:DUF4328 domain-containing protein [Actinomarinicola tropica]|uniref:DUF4328 domain-containing protein n=1 Tax=Actinomarinicola tropica TaxID=2789776 RepID=A0A5Q2RKY1_9ACTN|nr:DUF4328 domain-containing protein [Actinomarinicola tropica]QGG95086.1 DUF4328 domain-containing protein [Actinomarinicola tropica]
MSDTPTATEHPAPSASSARWMQGAWWATALLGVATALTALSARDAAAAWVASGSRPDAVDWEELEVGASGAMSLLALATFAALVATIAWMWHTHRHLASVRSHPSRWGTGWTVIGWFIPVVNFVIPKVLLQESERVALDAAGGPRRTLSWVGHVFWVGWVVGSIGIGVATVVWDGTVDLAALESIDRSAVLDAYTWRIVGGFGLGVAGAAGALHLRRLHRLVVAAGGAAPDDEAA